MPTGKLKAGKAHVAGVTTIEIVMQLDFMVLDRNLRSRSQALGLALDEWAACCGRRVVLDDGSTAVEGTASGAAGVVRATDTRRERV